MSSAKTQPQESRRTARLLRVLLDRLGFACADFEIQTVLSALGFTCVYDQLARKKPGRPKPYARVCRYRHPKTGTQVEVAYERLLPWMPEVRVVLVANDLTGLRRKEVNRIQNALPKARLFLVEIAFDFERESGVGRRFVFLYGRFGKSQVRTSRRHPDRLWFGSRRSAKFVRAYPKPGVADFRVELELHRGFLRQNEIKTVADLHYLSHILVPDHIYFCEIDGNSFDQFASRHLRYADTILRVVSANRKNLGRILSVLQNNFGLRNLHRYLTPLAINLDLLRALKVWARNWLSGGA